MKKNKSEINNIETFKISTYNKVKIYKKGS